MTSVTRHPLERDGTSRSTRLPSGLDPDTAMVDDRGLAELMAYVHGVSHHVSFYSLVGKEPSASHAWNVLLDGDPIVEASRIARSRLDATLEEGRVATGAAARVTGSSTTAERARRSAIARAARAYVEACIVTLGWSATAPERLAEAVDDIRADVLEGPFTRLLDLTDSFVGPVTEEDAVDSPVALLAEATPLLRDALESDAGEVVDVPVDDVLSALEEAADALVQSRASLASSAADELARLVEGDIGHHADIGLILAFLHLYVEVLAELNGLTARHLSYFFERVLGFRSLPSERDRAVLVFELTRPTEAHTLPAGTALKGGKEPSGIELRYVLSDDVQLDRASVDSLRGLRNDEDGRWLAATAADSADGAGEPLEGASWPAFGPLDGPVASPGFAVASPVMRMTTGSKTITLTIAFRDGVPGEVNAADLRVRMTGEEGWNDVQAFDLELQAETLALSFTVDNQTPIVDAASELHGTMVPSGAPVLEVRCTDTATVAYATLSKLRPVRCELDIEVAGARPDTIQGDQGALDDAKAFHPFGAAPTVGSSFIVGSRDVFQKRLSSLSLRIGWVGRPDDLDAHYSAYPDSAQAFVPKLRSAVLSDGSWVAVDDSLDLFAEVIQVGVAGSTEQIGVDYELSEQGAYDPGRFRGYLRLQLSEPSWAFGHSLYPGLFAASIVETSVDIPAVPYTPIVESLTLEYEARATLDLDADVSEPEVRLYQVGPFGVWEREDEDALVPTRDADGELLVGITNARAGRSVSLYLAFQEGTGDPFLERPSVDWHALTTEGWIPLEAEEILRDSTEGLARSGVVTLVVPDAIDLASARLPSGLAWVRASVPANASAIDHLYLVSAQAGEAWLENDDGDLAHLDEGLAAESVTKLVDRDDAVKAVAQPFATMDGRSEESVSALRKRAAERLRHKDRAVELWDYEHLVLQAFPTIYKVKCVPHATSQCVSSPGSVLVVVVPAQAHRHGSDPLRPAVSQSVLSEVHDLLAARVSPFVELDVVNPLYESIRVRATVSFAEGEDPGASEVRLDEDLRDFLSPWASGGDEPISFGAQLHRSVVLEFIELRPYVSHVKELSLSQSADGVTIASDVPSVQATTARSILVSHASHEVTRS